jgi:hypothetical protein
VATLGEGCINNTLALPLVINAGVAQADHSMQVVSLVHLLLANLQLRVIEPEWLESPSMSA